MMDDLPDTRSFLPGSRQRRRLRRTRLLKDGFVRIGVMLAGCAVIGALALIVVYIGWQTAPIFQNASINLAARYSLHASESHSPLLIVFPRNPAPALSVDSAGNIHLFETGSEDKAGSGHIDNSIGIIAGLSGETLTAAASVPTGPNTLIVLGTAKGKIQLAELRYPDTRQQKEDASSPDIQRLFGDEGYLLDKAARGIRQLSVQSVGNELTIIAVLEDGQLLLATFEIAGNHAVDAAAIARDIVNFSVLENKATPLFIRLAKQGNKLLLADDQGNVHLLEVTDRQPVKSLATINVTPDAISALQWLAGDNSFITGDSAGRLVQWFVSGNEHTGWSIERGRALESMPGPIAMIASESSRRGFQVVDTRGNLGIYYVTATSALLQKKLPFDGVVTQLALSPDNRQLLVANDNGEAFKFDIRNEHPDLSFSSIWQKIHYEGRSEAEYVWQPASSNDLYEAKMSLVPLTTGTLKAALFSLLFAVPLGVMAAIYTACFMQAKLRGIVKPAIEMMEALPTVIVGFLAAIWLAPVIENHLILFFTLIALLPPGFMLFGFAFSRLPDRFRESLTGGREALLLLLPLLLLCAGCFAMAPVIEKLFFAGDMRIWFSAHGMDYQQRNALVIGIAMGFAIIPTIFTLSEDALFNVPGHLSHGSMALGATAWQTLYYVILPAASAGILSAIMLGFGRAMGETMIILMASSNSPVVNFNIFDGLRGITATLAIELPEAAPGSSHFRVLFLAALMLLIMTFAVNTLAEIIRQRIRKQYKNL